MPEDLTTLILGIDLGGTKILTAVTDSQGKMLSRDHSITPAQKGHEAVIQSILESAYRALEQADVAMPLPFRRLEGKAPEIQGFAAGRCSYNKV